jgi:hypothetical protein
MATAVTNGVLNRVLRASFRLNMLVFDGIGGSGVCGAKGL